MERDAVLLSGLARRLGAWRKTMARAVGAAGVDVTVTPQGLVVTAMWAPRPLAAQPFSKAFSKDLLLKTAAGGAHSVTARPCDLARAFIREVLDARGITNP